MDDSKITFNGDMQMILRKRLKEQEGFSMVPYKDTMGFWTIYWGHKINKGEVFNNTTAEAETILDKDIYTAKQGAKNICPDFDNFTESRQNALVELVFNMGASKLINGFPRMIHNINIGDWVGAANELKYADGKSTLSHWYQQVHAYRADHVISELIGEE